MALSLTKVGDSYLQLAYTSSASLAAALGVIEPLQSYLIWCAKTHGSGSLGNDVGKFLLTSLSAQSKLHPALQKPYLLCILTYRNLPVGKHSSHNDHCISDLSVLLLRKPIQPASKPESRVKFITLLNTRDQGLKRDSGFMSHYSIL